LLIILVSYKKNDMALITNILRQETGQFSARFAIGPARWDFWDLLWLHKGQLELTLGAGNERLNLQGPSGVLIPPGTDFKGRAIEGNASASIVHFEAQLDQNCVQLVPEVDCMHVQNLIQLSLDYCRRSEKMDRRIRLLVSILDCFSESSEQGQQSSTRLDRAWREAILRLDQMRSVADVATIYGQAESTFRAAHRKQFGSSAGRHLQQLRLSETERYLATTGFGIAEIARLVGYAHAETLSAVFKRSRGKTPGEFRRWCQRFA